MFGCFDWAAGHALRVICLRIHTFERCATVFNTVNNNSMNHKFIRTKCVWINYKLILICNLIRTSIAYVHTTEFEKLFQIGEITEFAFIA